MQIKAKIKNGELFYGQPLWTARIKEIYKRNENKYVVVTIDNRETNEMRRFFEGGIVPYFFYQHPKSGWKDFNECRELLKLEFNGVFIHNKDGKSIKITRSTKISKAKFIEFLGRIQDYCNENSLEWPDAEQYKRWRDGGPDPDEIYPPVLELKRRFGYNVVA